MNRKCVTMNVLDGSNANSFWIIPCRGVINEQQQKGALFPMESDLVLVTRSAAGKIFSLAPILIYHQDLI